VHLPDNICSFASRIRLLSLFAEKHHFRFFAFIMPAILAFLMTGVITFINTGFDTGWANVNFGRPGPKP
jgi:hypothetical protein